MKMKRAFGAIVHHTILSPPKVCYCSQTIYEALLGCCRMWEATNSFLWKDRATHLFDILEKIQQPDGGFDIGYEFNFGYLHRKGESTSPELVALVALTEYARLFGNKQVEQSARSAVEWIRKFAFDMGDGKVAIPYGPYSIEKVMVYNGTSFACGALGCYLGQFSGAEELQQIYHGMVKYLKSVLSVDERLAGRFWYYSDQSRDDLDSLARNKIDYYHQMQQVEMHALAQQVCPIDLQLKIIRDAADHIVALHDLHPIIPYTNNSQFFKGGIHLWGLSSVVSGMLEAAVVIPDQRETYHKVARDVLAWILEHAWNGQYFEAILQENGGKVEPRHYMVRSDAWVLNALAAAAKHLDDGPWNDISRECYEKMESIDFSGPESHASNLRTRMVVAVWVAMKRLIRK